MSSVSAARPGIDAVLNTTESGIPLDQIARDLLGDRRSIGGDEAVAAGITGEVPWSWRAALLAGIASACLQAGILVLSAQTPTELIPGLPIQVGGAGSAMTPAVIAYGLWSGGSDAASTLMIAQFVLKVLKQTSPVAYALGGALVGVGTGYVVRVLMGGDDNMAADAITGLVAGFLYRMLAGVKAVKA